MKRKWNIRIHDLKPEKKRRTHIFSKHTVYTILYTMEKRGTKEKKLRKREHFFLWRIHFLCMHWFPFQALYFLVFRGIFKKKNDEDHVNISLSIFLLLGIAIWWYWNIIWNVVSFQFTRLIYISICFALLFISLLLASCSLGFLRAICLLQWTHGRMRW